MELALVLLGILEQLIPLYTKVKEDASKGTENTPEQEANMRAREQALFAQPWMKPEQP